MSHVLETTAGHHNLHQKQLSTIYTQSKENQENTKMSSKATYPHHVYEATINWDKLGWECVWHLYIVRLS